MSVVRAFSTSWPNIDISNSRWRWVQYLPRSGKDVPPLKKERICPPTKGTISFGHFIFPSTNFSSGYGTGSFFWGGVVVFSKDVSFLGEMVQDDFLVDQEPPSHESSQCNFTCSTWVVRLHNLVQDLVTILAPWSIVCKADYVFRKSIYISLFPSWWWLPNKKNM